MSARPATPASPKNQKVRAAQPGQPMYGCGKSSAQPAPSPSHAPPSLTPTRTPAAPLQPGPGHHQHLDPALQGHPAEHLRHEPLDLPDGQGHRRPDRHLPHAHLPLPTMPLHPHRRRPHKARDQEVTQVLYVGLGGSWVAACCCCCCCPGICGLLTRDRCRLEERFPLLPDVRRPRLGSHI